jgi:hypothetical protein
MDRRVWKYALVAALALAVGAAGTAGAARLLTGRNIKDGSIGLVDISKKARAKLRGARGPQGLQGPAGTNGTNGINGAPGAPGTSGSTAPSLMLGTTVVTDGQDVFATPYGNCCFGSEVQAQVPVPPGTSLSARDFTATASAAPGGTNGAFTVTLRVNGVATALACSITTVNTSCQGADVVVPLPAGSKLAMRIQETGDSTALPKSVSWGFRVVF